MRAFWVGAAVAAVVGLTSVTAAAAVPLNEGQAPRAAAPVVPGEPELLEAPQVTPSGVTRMTAPSLSTKAAPAAGPVSDLLSGLLSTLTNLLAALGLPVTLPTLPPLPVAK